jgi:type III secretory pathway component EscS
MIASIDWVTLHQKFGFVLVVAAVIGGVVGLISLVTPLVGFALKIYLRLLLLAVAIEVVLGGALYLMGHRPAHELHYLYGAGMAVTLGVTFAVSRRTPWPLSKLPLVIGAIVAVVFAVLALISG